MDPKCVLAEPDPRNNHLYHDDTNPSASHVLKNGKVLDFCSICGNIHFQLKKDSGAWEERPNRQWVSKKQYWLEHYSQARYDYQRIDTGDYTHTKFRILNRKGKKDFRQGFYRNGLWNDNINGIDTSLSVFCNSCIKELKEAIQSGQLICYAEGCKDCITLWNYGKIAFTCGGAMTFKQGVIQYLKNAKVIVFGDNEDKGINDAQKIVTLINTVGTAVMIIPPGVPEHGDISDYMGNHNKEDLDGLIEEALKSVKEKFVKCTDINRLTEDVELSVDKNGKVIQSISNCVKAINHDQSLKEMFRFNELTDKVEVVGAWWKQSSVNMSDVALNNVRLHLETAYGLTHEKNIPRAIEIIANERRYHPIKEFLESQKYDGGKYIENLLPKYLGATKSPYTTCATQITFLEAIERVYKPGAKADNMLCIVGEEQGTGKSTMVRFIAGRDEWFSDDLGNLDDENVYRKLQGHWVVEMSEMLATANAKTVESIKAFLSRQKDTYKVPYDRYPRDFPRQTIFIGTSNNLDFLPNDRTGNRRFIPVLVNGKKAEIHPLEKETETRAFISKCWAEAMEIYRSGNYSLTFPKELQEELLEAQQKFTPEDSKAGIIQEWLDVCKYDSVCSRMIYKEALGKDYQEPKEWELREINAIMNRSIVGWKRHPTSDSKVRFQGYGKQRAWDRVVPEKEVPKDFVQLSIDGARNDLPFD